MPNHDDISEDDQIRLDAVCEEFGIELCSEGTRPLIAEFVASVSDTLQQRLSDRLLGMELAYNARNADTPSIRDVSEVNQTRLNLLAKVPGQIPSDTSKKTSAIPNDGSPETFIIQPISEKNRNFPANLNTNRSAQKNRSSSSGSASDANHIEAISPAYDDQHKYVVEEEIDRGGMGVVLKVWDLRLRRTIALKVIRGQESKETLSRKTIDEGMLHRFVREAQITGRLDHPGVVPIHELARDDENRLYFTMKFVEGETLKSVFQEHWQGSTHWTQSRIVDVIIRVCETLAFAHSRGVIHRDLKPANIMVGKFGEVYVMDWGLAKVLGEAESDLSELAAVQDESSSQQTMYGAAVGTPSYMPPEQAAGKLDELDFRTDVYALGTLLYELLSNQRPYATSAPQSGQEIIGKVLAGPPLPIRELNRKSTPELVAIAQKAMQRDKASRYDSASDLAEELRAFLSQRVVTAYRTGLATRLKKWIARNQSLTIAGMLTLVSIIGALIVVMAMQYYNRNEMVKKNKELTGLVREKDIANTNAVIAQNESNGLSLLSHSRKLREAGNATLAALLALEAVKKYPKPQATETLYAAAAELVTGIELRGASGSPTDLVWSPDDSHVLTVHVDGRGFIWSPEDSRPVAQLVNRQERSFAAARYAKDGKSIVTVGADGTLATWDSVTGTRILAMDVGYPKVLNSDDTSRPDLLDVTFCLNDHCVVTMTSHQTIHLIDLNARREIATLRTQESAPEDASFGRSPFTVMQISPDGRQLVVGCTDGTLMIWELSEQRLVKAIRGHEHAIHSICFAPDGLSFVTCDAGSDVINLSASNPARLWATQTGERIQEILPKGLSVSCAAYHPNKPCIALGLGDGSICLWSSESNSAFCFSAPQADHLHRITFSPTGDQLASVARTARLVTWQVSEINGIFQLSERDLLSGHVRPVIRQEFSASGLAMASASGDSIRIWHTCVERPVPAVGNVANLYGVRINSAGNRIFAVDSDGTGGRLWSYPELEELAALDFGGEFAFGEFTRDCFHLVTATSDGTCRLWNVDTGVQECNLKNSGPAWAHGCAGDKLYLSGPAGTTVWNWRSGEQLTRIPMGVASAHRLALSGHFLLADPIAGESRTIVRIDPDSGNATPIEGAEVTGLGAFSANERYVWCTSRSASSAGTFSPDVKVIDTVSNRILFTTSGGGANVRNVAFSADGSRLLIDYAEHPLCSVEIYSIPKGDRLTQFGEQKESVTGWSSDLARVVTRSSQRGTRLWDSTHGAYLASLDLTGKTQLTDFSADGSLCAVQFAPGPESANRGGGSISLWDSASCALIAALPGDNGLHFGSTFLPDRSALLTISGQHTLRLWPIHIDVHARKYIDRNLTSEEQTMYGVDSINAVVAELPFRESEWNSFDEQIRLLSPVTKERRAVAWSLLDAVTKWLGEMPDPAEAAASLNAVDRLITGPFDTDPRLLAKIAALHEKHGDRTKSARLMEWAAIHPRADTLSAELQHSRKIIAPAVATDRAADELFDHARFNREDAVATENLTKAKVWARKESPHFDSYLTARELQLSGDFDEASRIFSTLISDEFAGPETLLHYAECELALSRPQQALDSLRTNLARDEVASPQVWNLWLHIAFRDLGRTPQQVQLDLPTPQMRLSAEPRCEQHVRWLLDQLINSKPVRLNCGGEQYIAANGDEWGRDAFFTYGLEYFGSLGDAAVFSHPIRNTADGILYQTERFFSHERTDIVPGYRIPLPNGTYAVTLGFAEIYDVHRSFDVRVENQVVLSEYDPSVSDSDWATAHQHQLQVVIEDGQFDLYFVPRENTDPKISCIQISAVSGNAPP